MGADRVGGPVRSVRQVVGKLGLASVHFSGQGVSCFVLESVGFNEDKSIKSSAWKEEGDFGFGMGLCKVWHKEGQYTDGAACELKGRFAVKRGCLGLARPGLRER